MSAETVRILSGARFTVFPTRNMPGADMIEAAEVPGCMVQGRVVTTASCRGIRVNGDTSIKCDSKPTSAVLLVGRLMYPFSIRI